MLIDVATDIVERAIQYKSKSNNDALIFLQELALAVRRGKHIVRVACLDDTVLRDKLKTLMTANEVSLLMYSQHDRSKYRAIESLLQLKAYCSYGKAPKPNSEWSTIIHINPDERQRFEIEEETHVIGENLLDSVFYEYVRQYYAQKNRIRNSSSCYLGRMGGGRTTESLVLDEIRKAQHFCLIITDSDLKYKGDTEIGSTAQSIKEIMDAHNPFNCKFYSMKSVREVENLIPATILTSYADGKLKTVLSFDYSFYDLKKGLDFCSLRKAGQCDYWKSLYGCAVDFTEFDAVSADYPNYDDFKRHGIGKTVLPGFGKDLLKNVLSTGKIKKQLATVQEKGLTPAQKIEWEQIGKLMFNWTCALPAKYA